MANETPEWTRSRGARFVTTHWSEVLAAGEGPSAKAQAALEQLYRNPEVGQRLNLSEGGVKSAVSRLRSRYRELVQQEVAQTVANPVEVDAEIQHLFSTLTVG